MKKRLIQTAAIASVVIFSSAAMAGGANCDSKKGHSANKDMSAEAKQKFIEDHAWVYSHGSEHAEKSATNSDKMEKKSTDGTSSNLVEI